MIVLNLALKSAIKKKPSANHLRRDDPGFV